jgi:hypothetical protein
MDKIKKYEQAILSILEEYAKIHYDNVKGGNYVIADKEQNRYQVVTIGWQGYRFVHDCPMHMDIIKGKVWIHQNMTEWDIGAMLEAQGVPKTDIVLGFLAEKTREYSDYAIA